MIEKIVLHNYKSIPTHHEIKLSPLNVLIGRNGAGKSNFLSFFQLLCDGANERFNSSINKLGGFSELLHYGVKPIGADLFWQITFTEIQGHQVSYAAILRERGNASYRIHFEELGIPETDHRYLVVADSRVELLRTAKGEQVEPYEQEKIHELAISQIRDRVRYPILDEIRNLMAEWQIFHGFGDGVLQNIRNPQVFNVVQPLRLDPSGANLVSVLHELANQPQYEATYERLVQVMQVALPDFVRFYTPVVGGGMASLSYKNRNFENAIPALSMSDGELRFLGLATLLLLPNPPSLICIDEPEIGLHPRMLPILAELLKDASTRTQIIITTHSPELISAEAIAPEDVIVVDQENGSTIFKRVDADGLKIWLERYTLGRLWMMGKLDWEFNAASRNPV